MPSCVSSDNLNIYRLGFYPHLSGAFYAGEESIKWTKGSRHSRNIYCTCLTQFAWCRRLKVKPAGMSSWQIFCANNEHSRWKAVDIPINVHQTANMSLMKLLIRQMGRRQIESMARRQTLCGALFALTNMTKWLFRLLDCRFTFNQTLGDSFHFSGIKNSSALRARLIRIVKLFMGFNYCRWTRINRLVASYSWLGILTRGLGKQEEGKLCRKLKPVFTENYTLSGLRTFRKNSWRGRNLGRFCGIFSRSVTTHFASPIWSDRSKS